MSFADSRFIQGMLLALVWLIAVLVVVPISVGFYNKFSGKNRSK